MNAGQDALGRLVDRRSEESPHLPDEDREDDRERGESTHLDRRREGLHDPERDERLVGGEWPLEPLDQCGMERETEQERRHDRRHDDQQPVAELRQMLNDGRLFVRAETARGEPAHVCLGDGFLLARLRRGRGGGNSRGTGAAAGGASGT